MKCFVLLGKSYKIIHSWCSKGAVITLTKVKYTLSNASNILKVYIQNIFEVYLKYTWSILQIYSKYTSSILQPVELQKKKYTSSLYYFDKKSTFETHFVKLDQHFNVNLNYASSLL